MSRKKRKRKQPGHFCWACGRRRPNEKFSGRGHARHVCRECAKLGAEELAYRQALRNLERCMTWEGIIPRKRRKSFEEFLDHKDRRIARVPRRCSKKTTPNEHASARCATWRKRFWRTNFASSNSTRGLRKIVDRPNTVNIHVGRRRCPFERVPILPVPVH